MVLTVREGPEIGFHDTVLRQVQSEVSSIKAEYRDRLSEELIDQAAGESLRRLAGSRVTQFVPLFVGRFTRQRIKELLGSGELPGD